MTELIEHIKESRKVIIELKSCLKEIERASISDKHLKTKKLILESQLNYYESELQKCELCEIDRENSKTEKSNARFLLKELNHLLQKTELIIKTIYKLYWLSKYKDATWYVMV